MLIELKANTVSCRCPYHIVDWSLLLSLRLGGKDQKITLQGDFFCIRSWIISYPSSTGIANVHQEDGWRYMPTLYCQKAVGRQFVFAPVASLHRRHGWGGLWRRQQRQSLQIGYGGCCFHSWFLASAERRSNNLVYICEESRKLILAIH